MNCIASQTGTTVRRSTVLSYGFLGLPLALLAISFYVYLPKYYADVVKLDVTIIGHIVLLSRIFDAVIDPSIGSLSDQTVTTWGRRRPWILLSALPLAASYIFLCMPELAGNWLSPTLWFAFWTFAFFLFWTTLSLPYEALGAELSFDYHERTRVLGFREGAVVLGTVLAACFPVMLDLAFPEIGQHSTVYLGILYALLVVVASILCFRGVSEVPWAADKLPKGNIFVGARQVLRNRPFRILLISYTVAAFGGALPATLILFYVEDVLQSSQQTANGFLVLYFLVGFLFLPLWIRFARTIGKKQAWLWAMSINTGAFAGVFFLGAGDLWGYGLLVTLSAIGYGATLAIPSSMQADVIDLDEFEHGVRREGQFVGFWSIAKKLSAALGAGLALQTLGFVGYVAEGVQSEETIFTLRFLYAGVPCICNAIAIAIALRYPLDRETHESIRAKLEPLAT